MALSVCLLPLQCVGVQRETFHSPAAEDNCNILGQNILFPIYFRHLLTSICWECSACEIISSILGIISSSMLLLFHKHHCPLWWRNGKGKSNMMSSLSTTTLHHYSSHVPHVCNIYFMSESHTISNTICAFKYQYCVHVTCHNKTYFPLKCFLYFLLSVTHTALDLAFFTMDLYVFSE